MAAKVSKKTLKEPDFLQVKYIQVTDYLTRHQSKIYVILALHLLGLAVFFGWRFYRLNYNKSALNVYNQVEALALKSTDPKDFKPLVEGYKNVTATYPNSQATLYSYYKLGNLYLEMNEVDLSLQAYEEFIRRASDTDLLKIFAYRGKGYCYELKKDFKNALESFDNALKLPSGTIFEGQIYRDMGRVYEGMNDSKKSLEYYSKSLEKSKDPAVEMILKKKIAELG